MIAFANIFLTAPSTGWRLLTTAQSHSEASLPPTREQHVISAGIKRASQCVCAADLLVGNDARPRSGQEDCLVVLVFKGSISNAGCCFKATIAMKVTNVIMD